MPGRVAEVVLASFCAQNQMSLAIGSVYILTMEGRDVLILEEGWARGTRVHTLLKVRSDQIRVCTYAVVIIDNGHIHWWLSSVVRDINPSSCLPRVAGYTLSNHWATSVHPTRQEQTIMPSPR